MTNDPNAKITAPKFDRAATTTILAASAVAIAGAFLLASPWRAADISPAQPAAVVSKNARPVVEVVFAIDTTGSMAGLLESAKAKVWTVANQIMTGQPRPEVRFGLVFYRDTSDAYVTQATPLTTDIDAIYETLLAAEASGGGDQPEHVNRALEVAIDEMKWKKGANVLRLVFLVGDAPPHDDYTDTPTSLELAKRAAKKNITINPLLVGTSSETKLAWQAIASAGGGRYAAIAQDGGTIARTTPFDNDLARYNRQLADSAIYYGGKGGIARARRKFSKRRDMEGEGRLVGRQRRKFSWWEHGQGRPSFR